MQAYFGALLGPGSLPDVTKGILHLFSLPSECLFTLQDINLAGTVVEEELDCRFRTFARDGKSGRLEGDDGKTRGQILSRHVS